MHPIRLRAAWTFEGGVAQRRFNRPTGLEGVGGEVGDRVWLVWEGVADRAELNGEALPGGARHEVTGRLKPANLLRMAAEPGVLETVRLEIGPPAVDR